MPEETIDPGLLEQTKNQIRQLVGEIAELAESDIQPPEFYVEFLNRAVAAVAASAGAALAARRQGRTETPVPARVPDHRADGRPRPDPAARRAARLHGPGGLASDHPGRGVGRGAAQRGQPHELRADYRAADGGQAGRRPARDRHGPVAEGGDPEEHLAVRQRPLRLGGDVPEEPPDAADDVAAEALESTGDVRPRHPLVAPPEGHELQGRQRRQAARRLRPPERDAEGRRPDDGRGRERAGDRRAAGQPDPRTDPALQGRAPVQRRPRLHRQHRRLRARYPRRP